MKDDLFAQFLRLLEEVRPDVAEDALRQAGVSREQIQRAVALMAAESRGDCA